MFAYEAKLHVENPLSFRCNEYGNIIRTSRILHNFALRFALNGLRGDPSKDHLENLKSAPIYATPAAPQSVSLEFQTFHPFPEAPQLFREPSSYRLASLGTRQAAHTILHYKEIVNHGSVYRFAVASSEELPKEIIISYGWKGSLQRVTLEAGSISDPTEYQGLIDHPINPLDFEGDVILKPAIKHAMPPSPLFEGRLVRPLRCRIVLSTKNRYLVPVAW